MHIGVACKSESLASMLLSVIPHDYRVIQLDMSSSLTTTCRDLKLDVMFYEALYPTRSEYAKWREISKFENTDLVLIAHGAERFKELVPNLYGVIEGTQEKLSVDVLKILARVKQDRLSQPRHTLAIPSFGESLVVMHGRRIVLTRTEMAVLRALIEAKGHYVSAKQLVHTIWGDTGVGKKEDLYVYISRLREKLEDDSLKSRLIVSSRGMGYAFLGDVNMLRSPTSSD
ncbi:winged helix-turn-helix domain-containing protein [Sulfoacidibacillus thermotolerans]|uniref:OmpR/PhoB-type domain-containing protein n=1 Tax=Sulfoacidibacillus thermotolerans TaxID=1765684 RepID=A0A2U3D2Y9_SULT2|nr:helix-turn-helix domain-containing protein [Sulfoacidibacillus thermotolerans]PWI55628.1 hypothetical protein BM613_13335 [Sulfoacidibacillus thermotolerans]